MDLLSLRKYTNHLIIMFYIFVLLAILSLSGAIAIAVDGFKGSHHPSYTKEAVIAVAISTILFMVLPAVFMAVWFC